MSAAVTIPRSDAAAAQAMSFTDSSVGSPLFDSTRGYSFDVVAPAGIMVTALGYFDSLGNGSGLAESHLVGLWNAAGTLLVSATVAAGVAAPLDANGLFRIVDIPDLLLPAGTDYAVGGFTEAFSTDQLAFNLVAGESLERHAFPLSTVSR